MTIFLILLGAAVVLLAIISLRRHALMRRRLRELTAECRQNAARTERIERHVYAASARTALAASGSHALGDPGTPRPRLPLRFLSQFGEDALLWDLLEGRLDGFFIEVGAFDGLTFSTTYAFEAVGWTGLLVEPLEDRFASCIKNRPFSRVVRAAVSTRGASGTAKFQSLSSFGTPTVDLASSLRLPAIQRRLAAEADAQMHEIQVPLTSLARLLDDTPGGPPARIDVAVIDVEGFERDALDGLELERYRPRVMFIEDLTRGGEQSAAALLRAADYTEIALLGHNRVWIDSRDPALLLRAQMLVGGGVVKGPLG